MHRPAVDHIPALGIRLFFSAFERALKLIFLSRRISLLELFTQLFDPLRIFGQEVLSMRMLDAKEPGAPLRFPFTILANGRGCSDCEPKDGGEYKTEHDMIFQQRVM